MLNRLSNILKEHSILYTSAFAMTVLPMILRKVLPHLNFLMTFVTFCGICTAIYGLLLHFEKSEKKTVKVTAYALRITALSLIAVFTATFIFTQVKIISAVGTTDQSCDCILVLGGGLKGKTLSKAAAARADAAIEYLNQNPECVAVMCGSQGKDEEISEARALYNYIEAGGIDSSRLIIEDRSDDTRQNIFFARDILKKHGFDIKKDSFAVVTNDFHLYRSTVIMQKAGFVNIHKVNAPTPNVPFLHASLFLREYFSLTLEFLNI